MTRIFLITAGVPVVTSAAVLLLSFLLSWSDRSRRVDVWTGSVAFGLSFFLIFSLINGAIPEFPPGESVNWIAYVALAAMALGIVEEEVSMARGIRWGGRLLLIGFSLYGTLYPMQHQFAGWQLLSGGVFVLLGIVGTWWLLERFVEDSVEYVIPLAYLICSTVGSVVILTLLSYAAMAQVAGAYSAICGVFFLVLFFRPSRGMLAGMLPSIMILLPLVLLSGWYFGSEWHFAWFLLMLIVLPNLIWVSRFAGKDDQMKRMQRGMIGALTVLVFSAGIALVVWYGQSIGSASDKTDDPYNSGQQEENEYDDYGY